MNPNYDTMTILRIAKYYYIDGLSQQEIAYKENIHRTQISRLLKQAREEGYVKIQISAPDSASADSIARELEHRLGLREVFVTPALSESEGEDQSQSLYFFAARHLETLLPSSSRVGIGVGKTMYQVAAQLSCRKPDHSMEFYSLAGYSGSENPYLQGSVIADFFARAFCGSCHYNNFPILTSRDTMSSLDQTRFDAFRQACGRLDTVILSIGGPFSDDYPYFEEFSLAIRDFDLARAFSRPHGNLLGHVFYEDGSLLQLPEPFMLTSMGPSHLQAVPRVICIAGGSRKIPAIISAARQGYISSLITDKQTAEGMLEKLQSPPPSSFASESY
ncbi:MAG: sugar-binding transcriptional regulator [Anaerovoracaceae bacterium]